MEMKKGLGHRAVSILQKLSREKPVFTFEEALNIADVDRAYLRSLLHRLEESGWVERIEKGKYITIPLEGEKGKYTLHEFVIGSLLVKSSVIAYWCALNYYGFTEQMPSTVFIQTISRKKKQEIEIFGVKYKIIRINERKFFGFDKVWIENHQINITDREKTVVDCLDKPYYCGGVIEIAKALKRNDLDIEKMTKYAKRIGNNAVLKRLGYLCDLFGIDNTISKENLRRGISLLDPSAPKKGRPDKDWKIIINLDEKSLGELE
jgi:predicted transcriptional regulator of viral defense system